MYCVMRASAPSLYNVYRRYDRGIFVYICNWLMGAVMKMKLMQRYIQNVCKQCKKQQHSQIIHWWGGDIIAISKVCTMS